MRKAPIALVCALVGVPGPVGVARSSEADSAGPPRAAAAASAVDRQVRAARRATARFRDLRVARRAGYEPVGECVPGMGFHYARQDLLHDPALRIRRPEILVYEKRRHRMRLVALEYMRDDADQRLDTDDDRPSLFGHAFDGPMEGHEPGAPVHYDLHAWLYKHNPDGRFTQLNPRITC